jgi:hypothetical protein
VRLREYAVPLLLLGTVVGFVAYQAIAVQRATATSVVARAAAPPQAPVAEARAGNDMAAPPDARVTVLASSRSAPAVDTPRVRELLREGAATTYLADLLAQQDGALRRWPEKRLAMRVWIQREAQLSDWNPRYPVMAERAFAEWQEAGFPLRFDMPLDAENIDIRIRWTDRFPPADGQAIGVTRLVRDQHGWLVTADIDIATHDSTGRPLPEAIVAGTARHEIGHALGLGHSSNVADVMFPESRTTVISGSDRQTLRLLYLLPPGRLP